MQNGYSIISHVTLPRYEGQYKISSNHKIYVELYCNSFLMDNKQQISVYPCELQFIIHKTEYTMVT